MRAFLATAVALLFCVAAQAFDACQSVPVYEPCEIEFEMTEAEAGEHPNPYLSVELRAEFRSPKGGRTSDARFLGWRPPLQDPILSPG